MNTKQPVLYRKGRLIFNPMRCHVTMQWRGRQLLGEVVGVMYDEPLGVFRAVVNHFNGEPWPVYPALTALGFLDRTGPEHDGDDPPPGVSR
jgi:hypothetical protein